MDAKYRSSLPQLDGKEFLSDGGLETSLIFDEGLDLPLFAAFTLMQHQHGRAAIDRYLRRYCTIAAADGKGFILDTPTWRASSRWAADIEVPADVLRRVHKDSIRYLKEIRREFETVQSPFVINGVIGPHDDGYDPRRFLSRSQARAYHMQQIEWFERFGADMISAITMTYCEEAIGIAQAAKKAGMPLVVSFTVETDGRLPSGQSLSSAIQQVDAETTSFPIYYMINCAHPDHFRDVLADQGEWRNRIMGVRANASRMSHAELDSAEELDSGDPHELADQYLDLKSHLPNLVVMGGCCGTDHRHIEAISRLSNHVV